MSKADFHIFWLAGENSGDLHASLVMETLNKDMPNLRHSGIGGARMQAFGLKPLMPFTRFNVMGFLEVAEHLGFFLKAEREIKSFLKKEKPDLAILVDYPGFNLRIAKIADELRIPVLYFICPQFWAWKHGRVRKLRGSVRHVACILPFEKELLDIHNVTSSYVGHPIAEEISYELDREGFARFFGLVPKSRWLGFFPGSRDNEVQKMLPIYLDAARELASQGFQILISKANSVSHQLFVELMEKHGFEGLAVIDGYRHEMMKYCELLVCTSGTATLEAGFIGTPLLICYKTSRISYWIGRHFVRIERIGLPNIILEKDLLPELVQNDCQAKTITREALALLDDPERMKMIRENLLTLRESLSEPKTSQEMLRVVKQLLAHYA
ncbi:MAG: lipid-A-disaccharide synthase [Candidatus Cloacimonadaceae bacterium]|jgi:lipid-A-disaccharide synthase|nr:lipid-A-disaccharide synthase [Candidatus Cloacimonadota bacterium]MDX9949899.1 lipid-A-disaccharide synthase [Candidatus Syntrophosphaera sp.]